MGFLVSQHDHGPWPIGCDTPPPFLSGSPLESIRSGGAIPPLKKGISAIPSDTKLLLTKNYFEIIIFKNLRISRVISGKSLSFLKILRVQLPSKITKNNSQGIIFVISPSRLKSSRRSLRVGGAVGTKAVQQVMRFSMAMMWLAWQACSLPWFGTELQMQIWPGDVEPLSPEASTTWTQMVETTDLNWLNGFSDDHVTDRIIESLRLQFRGGSVLEDEPNSSEFKDQVKIEHQHTQCRQQHALLSPSPEPRRRRRTKRIPKKCEYDPLDPSLQGECLFAVLCYLKSGEKATRMATAKLRNEIGCYLRNNGELLTFFAGLEGCTESEYQEIVQQGWGGLPEIFCFSSIYHMAIEVQDPSGNVIMTFGKVLNPHVITYTGTHYWVRCRSQARTLSSWRAPLTTTSRGGMPTFVTLKNNKGDTVACHRQRSRSSQRPPRRNAPPPTEDGWEAIQSEEEGDFQEHKPEQQKQVLLEKQREGETHGLLQHDELPADSLISKQGRLCHFDYLRLVQQQRYCILCRRFADPPHMASEKHYKRIKWIEEQDSGDRVNILKKTHQHTVDWFKAIKEEQSAESKATQDPPVQHLPAPARGGMKAAVAQAGEPASGSTSRVEQGVKLQLEGLNKKDGQESVTLPPPFASASATADFGCEQGLDDNAACATAVPGDDDYGTDPDSDNESSLSDAELAHRLSETLSEQGFRRLWFRGSQAWQPVHCNVNTLMIDIHIQLGLIFMISSDSIVLFKGKRQLPRTGTVGESGLSSGAEIWATRWPVQAPTRMPCRPLPVLDTVDIDANPQPDITNPDEGARMQLHDRDVLNVHIRNTKGTQTWQVYRNIQIQQLTALYAKTKKIAEARISPYQPAGGATTIAHDSEFAFIINPTKRGGAHHSVYVHDGKEWKEYEHEETHTTTDLRFWIEDSFSHMIYKGVELRPDIPLVDLHDDRIYLQRALPESWLRPKRECLRSRILTLAELSEWFQPDVSLSDHSPADLIALAQARFQQEQRSSQLQAKRRAHQRLLRGAGGQGRKGRLVWESTRTIKGLSLLTEVTANGQVISPISVDEVCEGATGVALALINTWSTQLKQLESTKPLLLLMPGKGAETLKRLGAASGRITEVELIYKDEYSGQTFKRQTTALSLSDTVYQYGSSLKSVTWAPAASAEYQLELDTRWAAEPVAAAARQDWRELVARLASQICVENIAKEDFYALRTPTTPPLIWSARLRLTPEKGEKLLCGSGLESLFIRYVDTELTAHKNQYTIVWGPKHLDSSAQTLTTMLRLTAEFPGHRGLARSSLGVGLRVKWGDIAKARQAIRPDDPCLKHGNADIKDTASYLVHGAPAAATAPEMAQFLSEIGWPTIPRSKTSTRALTTWFVSAEKDPPVWQMKWAEHLIYVTIADPEKLKQRRAQQSKKRATAMEAASGLAQPSSLQNGKGGLPRQEDPLLAADPWSRHDPWSKSSTRSSQPQQAHQQKRAEEQASASSRSTPIMAGNDPRVEAMMVRIDQLETTSQETKDHLQRVDNALERVEGNQEQLGISISSQFSAVMQQLTAMAELQQQQAEAPRKKAALAPFGSQPSAGS